MNNEGINELIKNIYTGLELNNFKTLGMADERLYDEPIIGIAAGGDPYFAFLKEHIGSFYWSPAEVMELKYGEKFDIQNLSVISLAFPQTMATKNMQNLAVEFPSDNWLVSRGEWEPMMLEFSGKLENELEKAGLRCASIDLRNEFRVEHSESLGIASRWSHRHTAFAAGLGTFSLNDGFITEKGIAVRFTSIVVEAELEITDRGDRGIYDWCLYYKDGSCGVCISRCPVGAITKENGHDKNVCSAYEDVAIAKFWPEHIDKKDYHFGCGLCQSKVPCRDKRP